MKYEPEERLIEKVQSGEIDLMTEEEWDNYDPSQENADTIIDIGM